MKGASALRYMFTYLKPYRLAAVIALILMLVELVVELWHPVLMARIINEGIMTRDTAAVWRIGAMMAGIALLGFVSGIINSYYAAHVSQGYGYDVRAKLFAKVQAFPFTVFNRFPAATLMTRMTSDVGQLQNAIFMALRIMMRAPLMMIGGLIMALTINLKLGLILTVLTPVLFGLLVWMMSRGFKLFQAVQERLDRTNGLLRENLLGMRLIKAMVRYAHERLRFTRANEDLMNRTISAIRLIELTVPALLMLMNISILFLLWYGSIEVQAGSADVGEIVAVVNYATRIMGAFSVLSWIVTGLARAKASADRVSEVLRTDAAEAAAGVEAAYGTGGDRRVNRSRQGGDSVSEKPASDPAAHGHSGGGTAAAPAVQTGAAIAFEHVSFRYPGMAEPALTDVSFTIRPGQTAAILGATGSGKSSLVQLLPRLYDPESGAVRLDGRDVREIDPAVLRGEIGYVPQEAVLFSGTIRANLLMGKEDADAEAIVAAARDAQIHETIMRLPEQYETLLGQKGVNLSGGQKQRLSVARALIRKPRVLLLDDSTSALDVKTEAALLAALKAYRCTTLLITQKISTAIAADVILILEDGRLHAMGTHDELLRQSPLYARIVRSQFGEEAASDG